MNLPTRRLAFVFLLFLAGCESTPQHTFTYAAQGTVLQAERLVGQFLGKDVWPIPYRGGHIEPPLQRMMVRFPEVRAGLDSGVLGLTDEGEVTARDAAASAEVLMLVREENEDRAQFYVALSSAVGHGSDSLRDWLRYVRSTFGAEWQRLAPSGWYLRDAQGGWRRQH